MTTPLETAVNLLQDEFDSYGQGTVDQPADGTTGWYLIRAAALGLAYVKRLQALGLENDIPAAERYYTTCYREFKQVDIPSAP
jgi:hypothetical protein